MNLERSIATVVILCVVLFGQYVVANKNSGSSFKSAMQSLGVGADLSTFSQKTHTSNSRRLEQPKLKDLDDILELGKPGDLESHAKYNEDGFGEVMARLTERLTGESLPEFKLPPPTKEEEKWNETPDQRAKRHRRQSSYINLLKEYQEHKERVNPSLAHLFEKIAADPSVQQKASEERPLYERSTRPKYTPRMLQQEVPDQQEPLDNVPDRGNTAQPSQYKLKLKKPSTQSNRSPIAPATHKDYFQLPNNVDEAKVMIDQFLASPLGKLTIAITGFTCFILCIRLLRLYYLFFVLRAMCNFVVFGGLATLLVLAFSGQQDPFVFVGHKVSIILASTTNIQPLALGGYAFLSVVCFTNVSVNNILQFVLSSITISHFLYGGAALTGQHILLYTSSFALLSIFSIIQLTSRSADKKPSTKQSRRKKQQKLDSDSDDDSDTISPGIIEKRPKVDQVVLDDPPLKKQTNQKASKSDVSKKKKK